MFDYRDYKIILYCRPTDMRKSINGLSSIMYEQFELDPRDKVIFAFCNNARNRIKMLVWADNGFWIHFKRVERCKLVWPTETDDNKTMILAFKDLKNIIIAPGITQKKQNVQKYGKSIDFSSFF